MFLLDTNVVSELRKAKSGKADKNVVTWAAENPVTELFISAITVQELEVGVLRVERRDAAQGVILRDWLESQVLPTFLDRVLPVDVPVARCCAQLNVPETRSVRDSLIAATALEYRMTVATRNVRDFEPTGVSILDPWLPSVIA
ncbi:type II toxin-antitoxin system VapC family toxin [Nocardia brasiliensis]|uniref:Ribonuclease VapC n=1 Tax=Nocardia brasiliensis (strain ATCC 700358 / HUJEG-1) TaxID=1133849 RepID=K0EM23_NOCB7|nr:type II toxin-antitoxin system VapC family toxin [Nocardia brasiliensis]AFT98476.1 putative plasmid stability protein [Nocardia brasiliensis ATCC 700358]OCF84725.1 twitching motility protein PilT [Nocardia brasiliensis]